MIILEALAAMVPGLDLSYRSSGTDWPAPWRARTVWTKNERGDLRLIAYGLTAEAALEVLAANVAAAKSLP